MNSDKNHDTNKNIKKTEDYQKSKSSKIFTKEMLVMFNDEEEKINSNIVYIEPQSKKKIKYISLDLLLKKIVIDDFLEKNQFLIYHFCQQCFCFIDSEILFRKIINCYQYYRSKGVPSFYLSNIITFFNILVIEMYDYYQEIKQDDASLYYINNFYEIIIDDYNAFSPKKILDENTNNLKISFKGNLGNLTDRDEDDKIELKMNFTKRISSNSKKKFSYSQIQPIEDKNCLNKVYNNQQFSIKNDNNKNLQNEKLFNKTDNYTNKPIIGIDKKDEGNIDINDNCLYTDRSENNEIVEDIKNEEEIETLKINDEIHKGKKLKKFPYDNSINYSQKQNQILEKIDMEEKLQWSNTGMTDRKMETKNEVNKSLKTKGKLSNFLGIFKKPKDKKENKSCDSIRKSIKNINLKNSIKFKKYKASDEEVLENIKNIKNYLLIQKPNKKIIDIVKDSFIFYKFVDTKKIVPKNSKELPNNKKMRKSHTEENLLKKKKKVIESKDYFDVQDWDDKEIGNKLLLISESLINKIQRKELYKAAYLKKDKKIKCPNITENIDKFNNLSFFIILDILSYDNQKDRAKMIEKWTKIAEYCKSINNFNDLFAINSALNNYIITGLGFTLKEVKSKTLILLKDINKFCDCRGNYKKVRNYMDGLKKDEYYLPYLGLLLKDLAFHEENSKYIINGILINLEKIETVQKIIDNFFRFKYMPKKEIEKISNKLDFFEHLESIKENKLEQIANNIEPYFNYSQKKIKRLTYIDKKFFSYNIKC